MSDTTRDPIDREEYRVGRWNGSVEGPEFEIGHDSVDTTISGDVEEMEDLENLIQILVMKDQLERGEPPERESLQETFDRLVRSLEA